MNKTRNEASVGAFVILGFILLTLVVFFVSGVHFFRSGYGLSVMYEYVSILDKGAPVRMAGVRIGEVSDVSLIYDEKAQKMRVLVKLFIEKGVEIRENYLFQIQGTHVLSEPHIEITPQKGELPWLSEGSLVEGVDPVSVETLIAKSRDIADEFAEILGSIRKMVQDEETKQSLKKIVSNLATLTDSMRTFMQGMEGSEKDFKELLEKMNKATGALDTILDGLESGEGTMGKLLTEDGLYQDMRDFVAEIKAHPWRLLKKDKSKK